MKSESQPFGVQLKRQAKWSNVSGLIAKQRNYFMASILYPFSK